MRDKFSSSLIIVKCLIPPLKIIFLAMFELCTYIGMPYLPNRVGRYKIPTPWVNSSPRGEKFTCGVGILYLPVRLGRYGTYYNSTKWQAAVLLQYHQIFLKNLPFIHSFSFYFHFCMLPITAFPETAAKNHVSRKIRKKTKLNLHQLESFGQRNVKKK